MESNIRPFSRLATSLSKLPTGGEAHLDRINSALTPALLLAIASLAGMRIYIAQPIKCWSTKEVDGKQRLRYAENYCWVEGTFYFDSDKPMPHTERPGAETTMHYYQWVPFILMVQAVFFYVPHLIWLMLSTNVGIDMRQLAVQSRKIESECTNPDDRHKKIVFLSELLLKFIRFRSRYRSKTYCQRVVSFAFGKPAFSMYFVFIYLLVKACYIGNCIGQLYLMRSFLGLNITSFGLKILSDIANNVTWQTSNVFPRVSYCHFDIRAVGKPRSYVLQCVLPGNMLNEKFYIAIWFWVVILLTLNVVSASRTLLQLLLSPMRQSAIRGYYNIAQSMDKCHLLAKHIPLEAEFVNDCINSDGLFLLMMVERHGGPLVTAEVAMCVYEAWSKRREDGQRRKEEKEETDQERDGQFI